MVTANPARAFDLELRGWTGDSTVSQTRLDEAWRALQLEVPSVPARLTDGTLDTAVVVDVVCAAALRVLRNPDGVKQDSGGVDDYTESATFADETQDLYFTAAELRRLQPVEAALTSWTGSVKYC